MRNRMIWTLTLCAVFASVRPVSAQTDRATLEGTVTDTSGAIVANAVVQITAVATGLSDERPTNTHGLYRFPAIAIGVYTVSVTRAGFRTKLIEDVVLQVGETRTLDIQLGVGEVTEKVLVAASDEPYERSSAESATVLRQDQIDSLPTNGRDFAGLTLLAPFAQDDGGGDQRTIRFAGRARDDNNFSFDGVDAGGIQEQAQKSQTRLQISEDAVAEYRVDSALYDAEYGTQAGGQINVVTRSGTNGLHGTVFGYLRNSAFDARNFNDATVPPFRMGQYGMSLGGPIKKEKTFFFINYEGLRQFQGNTLVAAVPTAAFAQSILATSPQMCSIVQSFPWRQSTGAIGACAPRFTFGDSFFSPLQPSDPEFGTVENFTHVGATTVHEDTWLVRIDHKLSDKTTLYGRAQRDISLVDAPNGNDLDLLRTINHPANYFLALQHIFTSNLANEAKVYVNRSPFENPQASVLPFSVSEPNIETINNNQADIEIGTTYGVLDNLNYTHGRHTFKAGMEIRRVRLNQGKTASNTLTFASDADFTNAFVDQVKFTAPWCCHKLRRGFYMPYFQDEWKVTSTFTANLGIRYEYYGVASEANNSTTVFDLNRFHGVCLGSHSRNLPGPSPIDTPPCAPNPVLYNSDFLNFDPRLSFAWAPGALHGKTVIRSGFGIYHGAAQNDDLNAGLESDTFTGSLQNAPLSPAFEQTVPNLAGFSNAANNPRALQREGRRDLYAEVWGLTIEHELPAKFMLSAAYLGSRGVRLFSRGAVNLCTTVPDVNGNCTRTLDAFYPVTAANPNGDPFGSVDIKRDIGSSSYHALGLTVERRLVKGFSFLGRYTFSHSINDGSTGGGESNGPENVNCLACDKGPSIFDIRHNFTADAVYQLPFGAGKRYLQYDGAWGRIVGGWSVSTIGLYHTGHPLTVLYNVQPDQLPDGNDQTNQRPDLVPGVPLYLSGGGKNGVPLINANAFTAPPQNLDPNSAPGAVTRFGNEGNGILRALPYWQLDLQLLKETKITERVSMEFGVQAFNIFNHVQLGDPHNLLLDYVQNPNDPSGKTFVAQASSEFGIINTTNNFNNNNDNAASPNTGTGLPRQIQFMLRARF